MPNQVWKEDCAAVQGASFAKVWIGIFLRREQLWCPTLTKGAGYCHYQKTHFVRISKTMFYLSSQEAFELWSIPLGGSLFSG